MAIPAPSDRVQVIKTRGGVIALESHAEVLMMPTGEIGLWTNRFSRRVGDRARGFAPRRKRPRWGHEDPQMIAGSITASTSYDPGTLRVHSAVGVKASHGLFVERGTGIYNLDGSTGPYEAKILPPWFHGSPSLYESTWKPGGKNPVAPVMIKGQRPQQYLERGLDSGMLSMKLRAYQLPDLGGVISKATNSIPATLVDQVTSGIDKPAFRRNLQQWRSWRDGHFYSGGALGNGSSAEHRRRELAQTRHDAGSLVERAERYNRIQNAERQRLWRERNPGKVTRQNEIRSARRDRRRENEAAQDRRAARRLSTAADVLSRQNALSQEQFEKTGRYQLERSRVTGLLQARGLTVKGNVTLKQDGTFRARVVKRGERLSTTISGKWR